MNRKLEKMLKETKNSRGVQSVPNRRYQEQNTPQVRTSKNTNNEDDEANASEPEGQENEMQDNSFKHFVAGCLLQINQSQCSIASISIISQQYIIWPVMAACLNLTTMLADSGQMSRSGHNGILNLG